MRSLFSLVTAALLLCLVDCTSSARHDLLLQAAVPSAQGTAALAKVLEENRATIYPAWKRAESQNFILFAPADGPVAGDMTGLLAGREEAYQAILQRLNAPPIGTVTIYAYNSSRQGQKMLGRPLSFALPALREMHIRWDQEPGHEVAHLVAWSWNQLGCGEAFLEEGLAVALSSHPGSPRATASDLLARGVLPDLNDLIQRFAQYRNGYVLAGSFIDLLLEEAGSDLVRELYIGGPGNLAGRLEEATGQSLVQLQIWWETSLAAAEPVTREPIVEAISLLHVGRVQDAINLLERQQLDLPDSPVLEFALAQARRQNGEDESSVAGYQRVLDMSLPYHLAWMKQRAAQALQEMGYPENP